MRFTIRHDDEGGWRRLHLEDTLAGITATVIPAAGAILNAFSIRRGGHAVDTVDGFRDAADWKERIERGFHSAKLSPFVCRVRDARYAWQGRDYRLGKFSLGDAAIHGLIYDAAFEPLLESAHTDHAEVEMKYAYTGSEPGYPFPYDCLVRYRLEADGLLSITTAVHNRSSTDIPITDGWHPYFRFGDKIDALELEVRSSAMLEYDDAVIPTGRTIPGTDWTPGRRIGTTELDNGFVLDFDQGQPLCTLSDPASGLCLRFEPDRSYPYLQLYTPPHRRSIAIENLSAAPDAFNNGIGLTVLGPDHTRTYTARLRLGTC